MEATKASEPLTQRVACGDSVSRQAVTCVNAEQASKDRDVGADLAVFQGRPPPTVAAPFASRGQSVNLVDAFDGSRRRNREHPCLLVPPSLVRRDFKAKQCPQPSGIVHLLFFPTENAIRKKKVLPKSAQCLWFTCTKDDVKRTSNRSRSPGGKRTHRRKRDCENRFHCGRGMATTNGGRYFSRKNHRATDLPCKSMPLEAV